MDIKAQRLEILNQVENGEMTPSQAARWLAALDRVKGASRAPAKEAEAEPESEIRAEAAADLSKLNPSDVLAVEADREAGFKEPEAKNPAPGEPAETIWVENAPEAGENRAAPETEKGTCAPEPAVVKQTPPQAEAPRPPDGFWRGGWVLAFVPGLLLVIAAVDGMTRSFMTSGLGWGFWLAFIPLSLGVVFMWLGWEIRSARWVYIHVRQRPGVRWHDLRLSFPLPTGLLKWALRRARRFDARLHGRDAAIWLDDIDPAVAADEPIHILIDEGGGERVEIWIGKN